jgi:hypothetical protein
MINFNAINSNARTHFPACLQKTSVQHVVANADRGSIAGETTTTTSCAPIDGLPLIKALWRTPSSSHQISVRCKNTNKFKNIPINNIDAAIELANTYCDSNCDVYLSCAEFLDSHNRTATNALGAWALWMDLDCGASKAANNHGYLDCRDAEIELEIFCKKVGLPPPTHIVGSGSGLHTYWVLDKFLGKETWQPYAAKLKALTKSFRFLADPSRTSDIASLLRMPGTLNFKSNEPKPVTLRHSSDHFLNQEKVLSAIDSAYQKLEKTRVQLPSHEASTVANTSSNDTSCAAENDSLQMDKLASALSVLDPDCEESIWSLRRIAPMVREAKKHPEYAEQLYQLCRDWSSGKLRGVLSHKWVTPGGNGVAGEDYFDKVWHRFLKSNYAGRPTTIHSIYFDASNAGWITPEEQFEIITTDIEERK